MDLFNEAEKECDPDVPEPAVESITYRRKKKRGHREESVQNLPVETIEYRLSNEEQVCSCCGGALHEMSVDVRKELKIIPAEVKVTEHKRYVYACRKCEEDELSTPIVTAKMPASVFPKSIASRQLWRISWHKNMWKNYLYTGRKNTLNEWVFTCRAKRWGIGCYI